MALPALSDHRLRQLARRPDVVRLFPELTRLRGRSTPCCGNQAAMAAVYQEIRRALGQLTETRQRQLLSLLAS